MTTAAAAQANPDAAAAPDAAAKAAADAAAAAAAKPAADDAAAAAAAAAAKKTADDAAAAAAAAANKPPEKYDLKRPDGSDDFLDDGIVANFEKRARAKGWSNEVAQAEFNEEVGSQIARSQAWRLETESDPTWGGDKLAETQRLANLALDKLAPKGDPIGDRFRALMLRGAAFNELSVIATLARAGQGMAEDRPIVGSAGAGPKGKTGKAAADQFYDHPSSQALAKETSG